MRIGIYGDSFASPHNTDQSKNISWVSVLKTLIPNCDIENHGRGATSVFYSYKKFLQTCSNYDKIIFLITNPDRYTKEVKLSTTSTYISSINQTDIDNLNTFVGSSKDKLTPTDYKILNDLKGWFMSTDSEFNLNMTELMMKDMEKIHNDIIFFPCYSYSISLDQRFQYGLSDNMYMNNLYKRQAELLNIEPWSMNESMTNIANHLGEEFNLFIAKVFANKIMNNCWDWSDVVNVKLNHELNYYFN